MRSKEVKIGFRVDIKAQTEELGFEEGQVELQLMGGDERIPPSVQISHLNAKDCTIDFKGAVLHRLMSNVLLRDLKGAKLSTSEGAPAYGGKLYLVVARDERTDYVRMFEILKDEVTMLLRHDWPGY